MSTKHLDDLSLSTIQSEQERPNPLPRSIRKSVKSESTPNVTVAEVGSISTIIEGSNSELNERLGSSEISSETESFSESTEKSMLLDQPETRQTRLDVVPQKHQPQRRPTYKFQERNLQNDYLQLKIDAALEHIEANNLPKLTKQQLSLKVRSKIIKSGGIKEALGLGGC